MNKQYMIKRLTVLSILLTLLIVLSGCDDKDSETNITTQSPVTDSSDPVSSTDSETIDEDTENLINDSSIDLTDVLKEQNTVKFETLGDYYYYITYYDMKRTLKIVNANGEILKQFDDFQVIHQTFVSENYLIIIASKIQGSPIIMKYSYTGDLIKQKDLTGKNYHFSTGGYLSQVTEGDSKSLVFVSDNLEELWRIDHIIDPKLVSDENPEKILYSYKTIDPYTNREVTQFLRVNGKGEKVVSEALSYYDINVKTTSDGGFIFAITAIVDHDLKMRIIKYDANNARQWEKDFGLNSYVVETSKDRIMILNNSEDYKIYIYDNAGNEIKAIPVPGFLGSRAFEDAIYIHYNSNNGTILSKYDYDGNEIWSKIIESSAALDYDEASYTYHADGRYRYNWTKLDENGDKLITLINKENMEYIKQTASGNTIFTYKPDSIKHLVVMTPDNNELLNIDIISDFYHITDDDEIYYATNTHLIKYSEQGEELARYRAYAKIPNGNQITYVVEESSNHFIDIVFDIETNTVAYDDTIDTNPDLENVDFDFNTQWAQFTQKMKSLSNYSYVESAKMNYSLNDIPFTFDILGRVDYEADPLYVKQSFDLNGSIEDKMYFNQIDGIYYSYQLAKNKYNDEFMIKQEITEAEYLELTENSFLDFALSYMPQNPTVVDQYRTDGMHFVEVTSLIKLSQLSVSEQTVLNEDLSLFVGEIDAASYPNAEIKQTILFNITEETIAKISFDTSNLMKLTYSDMLSTIEGGDTVLLSDIYSEHVFTYLLSPVVVEQEKLDNANFDDYGNDFFDVSESMTVPLTINGQMNYRDDQDYFMFKVDDITKALLTFESTKGFEDLKIYDELGNVIRYLEVGGLKSLELDPGVYYIEVSSYYTSDYQIQVVEVPDDSLSDTIYTNELLTADISVDGESSGTFDYEHDNDIYTILNETNSFVHVELASTGNVILKYIVVDKYSGAIKESYTRELVSNDGVMAVDIELSIGTREKAFIIVSGSTPGSYNISVKYYNETNDTADSVEDTIIDTLTGDRLTYSRHVNDDIDVAKFIISEAGNYNVYLEKHGDLRTIYMKLYDGNKILIETRYSPLLNMELQPGEYYVEFETSLSYGLYDFRVVKVIDDYKEVQAIDFSTNPTIKGATEILEDVDAFSFVVSAPAVYSFEFTKGSNNKILAIKNSEGIILFTQTFTRYSEQPVLDIYLSEGEYTLEISNNNIVSMDYEVNIVVGAIIDDYPEGTTTAITLGQEISGRIDYYQDNEVFLLEITEPGEYHIHYTNNVVMVSIYDEQGSKVPSYREYDYSISKYRVDVHLEPGVYTIKLGYQYTHNTDYTLEAIESSAQ